jgi:chromosome segregation ATPase
MKTVPEEQQRFTGAFAGLAVQGLDKAKLIESAKAYLQILETDSKNFNATLDAAVNEKVQAKKAELDAKNKKIEDLTREINDLNNQLALLTAEIKENEEKIKNSSSGYLTELENMKAAISKDIEKINKYI